MDNIQLRKTILNFRLDDWPRGNQGYSRVLLQLFGYSGHGKSSFINSCKYVIDEEGFIEHAKAKKEVTDYSGSKTLIRSAFHLTENITIVDNRGFSEMESFERAEIYAQLGNFIPIGEEIKWMDNYTAMMRRLEDAELNRNFSDFIVPIFIHSAANTPPHQKWEKLRNFMRNCKEMTGIFPIVLITHRNSGVYNTIKDLFEGLGAKFIIPIENYTTENHAKTQEVTEGVLKVLHKALEDVTSRLGEKRNPLNDWVQRKQFLLDYIHKADLKKKEEQWRREEEERREEEKWHCRLL